MLCLFFELHRIQTVFPDFGFSSSKQQEHCSIVFLYFCSKFLGRAKVVGRGGSVTPAESQFIDTKDKVVFKNQVDE